MNKHILILEDDVLLNKVYKHSLLKAGYDVSSLVSGVGVKDVIKLQRPDLILLDLVMPDKDGFAVLKELHHDSSVSTIPVIVLTNLSQNEDRDKIDSLGATLMYTKSEVSFASIIQTIETLLYSR